MSKAAQEYLATLSDEQYEAALTTDRPVMIIAGAGSGKTKTLVGRFTHIMQPVEEGGLGADPGSIMMVTFTNKAGREMRERIQPALEEIRKASSTPIYGEPWIGTFHGISLRILRIESERAGLGKNFSIFDESDSRALAKEVAELLELEAFDIDVFFQDLESAKARLYSHTLLAEKQLEIEMARMSGEQLTSLQKTWVSILDKFETPNFVRAYSAYQRALADQNAVDFNDLMNHVTKLFRDNPEIRDSWRSTFRHFMVDEVQDMNKAQIAWLDSLLVGGAAMEVPKNADEQEWASATDGNHQINSYRIRKFPKPSIAFVGDDDQAIYGFRGSDKNVMPTLQQRYKGMAVKFLNESYRCQPSILSIADTLVRKNDGRFDKKIRAANPNRIRSRILIEEHFRPEDEIRRIIAEARDHIAAGGDPTQFAVLVRTKDLVKAVARDMRAAGLPVTEGKASDIRKSAEVRDAMAFAGFLMNPDADTLLRRIINKPARKLSNASMGKVSSNAKLKKITFMEEFRQVMNLKGKDDADLFDRGMKLGSRTIETISKNAIEKGIPFIREFQRFMAADDALKQELYEDETVTYRRKFINPGALAAIDTPENGEVYKKPFIEALQKFGYLMELVHAAIDDAPDAGEALIRMLEMTGYLPDLKSDAVKAANLKNANFMDLPPREFLSALIEANSDGRDKVEDMTGEDLADRAGSLSETARRIGNLSILIEQAACFDKLEKFIQEAVLEMDQATATAGIQVMTMHGSKGLEFDRVRLPFWIQGLFPHGMALKEDEDAIDEDADAGIEGASSAGIEEERRLAYVAITRAREDVRISRSYMIRNTPWIRQRDSYPSQFIEEIRLSPREDFQITSVKGQHNTLYSSSRLPVIQKSPPMPARPPREVKASQPQNAEGGYGHAHSGGATPRARQGGNGSTFDRPFAPREDDMADMVPDYGDYEDFGNLVPDFTPYDNIPEEDPLIRGESVSGGFQDPSWEPDWNGPSGPWVKREEQVKEDIPELDWENF